MIKMDNKISCCVEIATRHDCVLVNTMQTMAFCLKTMDVEILVISGNGNPVFSVAVTYEALSF